MTIRTRDGKSEVVSETNVPDGEHQISGHDGGAQTDLSVGRRGADGRFIASAAHSHAVTHHPA